MFNLSQKFFAISAVLVALSIVSPVYAVTCHKFTGSICTEDQKTSCSGANLPGPCPTATLTPTATPSNAPTPTTIPEATLTPTPTPVAPSVPEFGLITGALALAASVGTFGLFKKKI